MVCLKEKYAKKKLKAKRIKMIANMFSRRYENYKMYLVGDSPNQTVMIVLKAKRIKMIVSVFPRRCGSYKMYLADDSPHQVIMIVCELK